ncbi:MAG: alginate export family protein [Candidatus Zixiibacteriota bacterium]
MKKSATLLLLTAMALLLLAAIGSAETKFSYDGQIRLRAELSNRSFEEQRHTQQYNDLRTRLGLKFEPTDMAQVYIQFQDSRRLGDPESGNLESTDNVDLHQAYFELQCPSLPIFYLKGGRFEVNYGNQRVFGAVGWHNIGRSWDGMIASFRPENYRVDFFYLKKEEVNSAGYNRDFDVFGVYSTFEKAHFDAFIFYELNADSNGYAEAPLKRFNLGGYYNNTFSNFDVTFQGNYQMGTIVPDMLPDTMSLDIAAFMVNGEFGYTFDGKGNVRTALGFDYTSGDDGTDATKYKSYTNAYYTGHAFRGYMDYFLGSPMTGLIDVMLRAKGNVAPNWILKGDFHYFKTAENYNSAVDGTLTSKVGFEGDITLVRKVANGSVVTGGLSVFSPEEDYAGKDSKMGLWGYLMWTVNF